MKLCISATTRNLQLLSIAGVGEEDGLLFGAFDRFGVSMIFFIGLTDGMDGLDGSVPFVGIEVIVGNVELWLDGGGVCSF